MNGFVRILSIAFLVARVSGQICVEETLDCNQPVPTIFKLGDASCACNSAAHAGALKYENGAVHVCTGSQWKTFQFLEHEYSCKDILDNSGQQQLSNGVYWIRLQGSQDPFPVYCDMQSGGWTMVFKVVSGVNRFVWDLYNSDQVSSELVTAALDVTNQHQDHYKNRVVSNWQTFNPSQAKVVLYEGGVAKKELVFNAQGTDKLNWFSSGKLTSSSWTDLTTQPKNYFDIHGDDHNDGSGYRSFFINKSYAGCGSDYGWLVISQNDWCTWDTTYKNKVIYSSLGTYTNWNSNDVAEADVLAVFLK